MGAFAFDVFKGFFGVNKSGHSIEFKIMFGACISTRYTWIHVAMFRPFVTLRIVTSVTSQQPIVPSVNQFWKFTLWSEMFNLPISKIFTISAQPMEYINQFFLKTTPFAVGREITDPVIVIIDPSIRILDFYFRKCRRRYSSIDPMQFLKPSFRLVRDPAAFDQLFFESRELSRQRPPKQIDLNYGPQLFQFFLFIFRSVTNGH